MSAFAQLLTGWRQSLARMVTAWQSRRPGAEVGWKWLFAMILPLDVNVENTLQGVNDWAPGSPNASPTALPFLGESRGLIQGEAETADHFAARLRNFRTTGLVGADPRKPDGSRLVWNQNGKTELLALHLQQFLGNTPLVRVIQRIYSEAGPTTALYVTANPDGSTSSVVAAWDWDSVLGWTDATTTYTGAETRQFWGDFWLVIYPAEYSIAGSIAPLTGQHVPTVSRDAILRLLSQWSGTHTFCRALIWSYDVTLFDPATPGAAGNPDGTWGNWAKFVGGHWVPARNMTARYWIPRKG